jgi:hypothetical protein
MTPDKRIITHLPLRELWTEQGIVDAKQVRDLSKSDIGDLLRRGQVRFVVADIGGQLKWISRSDCYEFWKSEAKERVADPAEEIRSWEYPSGYCYLATEWVDKEENPVVLLEVYH